MENNKKPENVHKGHRQRMRAKFLAHGLEGFPQHEALELLLYYTNSQKNTNELAHRLLKKFGSLAGIFDADFKSLTAVEGVGEQTAVLLMLQAPMWRMYMADKYQAIKNRQITPTNAGEYITTLFYGYTKEIFYLLSLDNECRLISADIVARGTVNNVAVYSREIVKQALENNAAFAIMAHNHPNGVLVPSQQDLKTTKVIESALHFINVKLIDHIIVANNRFISLAKDYHAIGK